MSKYLALSSSIPDFFAFLKRLHFFLISLFKFLFIHGRLCREFDNFDGMLTAKIPSMYSIKKVLHCSFEVKVGLHQGSVLSPLLFAAVMDVVGPWKKHTCRGPATITRLPSLFINQFFHNLKLLQPYDVCRHQPEPFYGPDCYICEH